MPKAKVTFDDIGVTLTVPAGTRLIEVSEKVGAGITYGCREGECATCLTKVVSGAEFLAERADLVLEQLAQRLDQLELHVLGQAADVVVALDDVGLAGLAAGGLDHVRVDGALGEEIDALDPGGFLVEHVNKQATDDLALGLGVGDARECVQKPRLGIHADHPHAEVAREHLHHLVAFVEAQQAVVDEHAGELVADRTVDQRRGDARIDTARQAEDPEQVDVAIIGIGPGNNAFNKIYPQYMRARFSALSAYSIFLEVLVETGFIGFSCFLWLLVVTFNQGLQQLRRLRASANPDGFWLIGAIAAMCGMLSHGLVDTVWYRPEVSTLWWLMVAIIASYYTAPNADTTGVEG